MVMRSPSETVSPLGYFSILETASILPSNYQVPIHRHAKAVNKKTHHIV